MLKFQHLQQKQIRMINMKLSRGFANITQQLADNQARIEAKFDAMTGAIVQLCTELKKDRAQHRRIERCRAHEMQSMTRAIGQLATATTQHSKRIMALQVEMGHYSGNVARNLQQITAAVEAIQTNVVATGEATDTADSEVTSRSSVSTLMDYCSSDAAVGILCSKVPDPHMLDIGARNNLYFLGRSFPVCCVVK